MGESRRNIHSEDSAIQPQNGEIAHTACAGLSDAILFFVKSQLGLNPGAIFIDDHGSCIHVTLKDILANAERNAANDKPTAILIAKTHTESFRSVCGILLSLCTETLKRPVESATLLLDPQSNYASILLIIER
jgi:uncharacterized protein YbcI